MYPYVFRAKIAEVTQGGCYINDRSGVTSYVRSVTVSRLRPMSVCQRHGAMAQRGRQMNANVAEHLTMAKISGGHRHNCIGFRHCYSVGEVLRLRIG